MKRQSNADRVAEVSDWIRTGRARRLREQYDLTQGAIASDCGVTAAAVTRWELRERRPSTRNALAYHRVLSRLASREPA